MIFWLLILTIGGEQTATASTFGPYASQTECETVASAMRESLVELKAPIDFRTKCVPLEKIQ